MDVTKQAEKDAKRQKKHNKKRQDRRNAARQNQGAAGGTASASSANQNHSETGTNATSTGKGASTQAINLAKRCANLARTSRAEGSKAKPPAPPTATRGARIAGGAAEESGSPETTAPQSFLMAEIRKSRRRTAPKAEPDQSAVALTDKSGAPLSTAPDELARAGDCSTSSDFSALPEYRQTPAPGAPHLQNCGGG
eukprot:g2786.t1